MPAIIHPPLRSLTMLRLLFVLLLAPLTTSMPSVHAQPVATDAQALTADVTASPALTAAASPALTATDSPALTTPATTSPAYASDATTSANGNAEYQSTSSATRVRQLFEPEPIRVEPAETGASRYPSTRSANTYALQLQTSQLAAGFQPGDTLLLPLPDSAARGYHTPSGGPAASNYFQAPHSAFRVEYVGSHVPGHHVLRAVNLAETSERLLLSWSTEGLLGVIERLDQDHTLLLHQAGENHLSSGAGSALRTPASNEPATTYILQEIDSHSHPALDCGTGSAETFPYSTHSLHQGSSGGSGGWGSNLPAGSLHVPGSSTNQGALQPPGTSSPASLTLQPAPLFNPFDLEASLAEQTAPGRHAGGYAKDISDVDGKGASSAWLRSGSAEQTTSSGAQGTAAEAPVTLDLLIVYTEKARMWALNNATSIGDLINVMIARSQEVLDNSLVDIELRVVRTWHTSFEEAGNESGEDLRKLTVSPTFNPWDDEKYDGHMEQVHDLRDEYGADLVSLLADITDVGGIAWQLNNLAGSHRYGFSVNRVQQMISTYTFIHEIGHNMGSAHSRNQNASPASIFGGLFEYSAGWRFNNVLGASYATVMTYEQGQSARVPVFSNPDVVFEGTATGSYDGQHAPADNARSLRYARHVVSNYRTSLTDPPELFADDAPRQVSASSGEQAQVSIALENTGQSNLHWTLDIGYRTDPLARVRSAREGSGESTAPTAAQPVAIAPALFSEPTLSGPFTIPYLARNGERVVSLDRGLGKHTIPLAQYTSTLSRSNGWSTAPEAQASHSLSTEASELLFTSFTPEQGFSEGEHQILDGWMALPKENKGYFTISQDNPATAGTQHLRLKRNTDTGSSRYTGVELPWLGPLTSQGFSTGMDLHFNTTNVQFHVIIDHASAGRPVLELVYFQGNTFRRTPDNQFANIATPWLPGAYFALEVVVEPWNNLIRVYHDGLQVHEQAIEAGLAPERIRLAHLNGSGTYEIDIDNIRVAAHYPDDLPRFPLRKVSGAVAAGNQYDVQFSVDTADLPDGSYTFDALLLTNDPLQPEQRIPVVVDVTDSPVSAESPDRPQSFILLQNYPNPFNPETTIAWELPQAAEVQLEVLTITGQRVALLVNGHHSAGRHEIRFRADNLASGMYLYRLQADGASAVRPMMLVK